MLDRSKWQVVERPGFLGKRRDEFCSKLDAMHGEDDWKFAWEVGSNLLEFEEAILLYEDAYFFHLTGLPICSAAFEDDDKKVGWTPVISEHGLGSYDVLGEVLQYQNVYDNAPTNVDSGLDYRKQENNANHYQDISIRRVLVRCGVWFKGEKKELLQIRAASKEPLGRRLNPGVLPFHIPHLIKEPELTGWWKPGTIESFWQDTKRVVTRRGD